MDTENNINTANQEGVYTPPTPPVPEAVAASSEPSVPETSSKGTGLSSNVAGALTYVLGFVTGIIFLLIEKENRFVRFHAMQSTITFGGLAIINFALRFFPWGIRTSVGSLLGLVGFIAWIILIYKAYNNEEYELPIVGAIARKQVEKI